MAVTKILARKGSPADGIRYILNSEKTQGQLFTAHLNYDLGREARQMQDTKEETGKTNGVSYYHMILSFKPGEVTLEKALKVAKEFQPVRVKSHLTVSVASKGV